MGYTQDAKERCMGLIDQDITAIWKDINAVAETATAEIWGQKIRSIAAEYTFSVRFALMRFVHSSLSGDDVAGVKTVEAKGQTDITMEHAKALTNEELLTYEKCLMYIASRQADAGQEGDADLIHKALQGRGRGKILTLEESFRLGHILGFSLQQMDQFLMRTSNDSDGFRFNMAEDVIEAYGFLNGYGWRKTASLKDTYQAFLESEGFVPAEFRDRENDWTQDVGATFPEMVRGWPAEERDERFLDWMKQEAPHLDLPSRSAQRIYRNLAIYAFRQISGKEWPPTELQFVEAVEELVNLPEEDEFVQEALYENGKISQKKCKCVADVLLDNNRMRSVYGGLDKGLAWRAFTVLPNGNPSTGTSRTRLQELLTGEVAVEKNDMLYLLWFAATLCWFEDGLNYGERDRGAGDRLDDLLRAANLCLEHALLPEFYPPHLMEQTLMLSVIYADQTHDDPSEVYDALCDSIKATRAPHTNKTRKKKKQDLSAEDPAPANLN